MRLRRGRIFLRVLSVSEEPCSQKAESGIITAEQVRYHDCYVNTVKKKEGSGVWQIQKGYTMKTFI